MKKIIFAFSAAVVFASCGGNETSSAVEASKQDTVAPQVCTYSYDSSATEIGFGAFKFTEKKEVKGSFLKFEITGTKDSDTLLNVFRDAKFSIGIKSVSTNDAGRDQKIKDKFFGVMDSTFFITGLVERIEYSADYALSEVVVLFKMNNIEKETILSIEVKGDDVALRGKINLDDFNAQKALASLNKACKDVHKGSDGISKTWNEVNIYVNTKLKNSCK